MTDPAATNGVSAWIVRAGSVVDVLNKLSLTTFLLILFGLGVSVWFGWINSPVSGTPGQIMAHDRRMVEMLDKRADIDNKFLVAVEAMHKEMVRSNAAYRLRICAEIPNPTLRQRCLDT